MNYVRGLPCSITGESYQPNDPHHVCGYGLGGMRTKPSDFFIMPIKHELHNMLHSQGVEWFEDMYSSQIDCVVRTLKQARKDGMIDDDRLLIDIMAIRNKDLSRQIEKVFCD